MEKATSINSNDDTTWSAGTCLMLDKAVEYTNATPPPGAPTAEDLGMWNIEYVLGKAALMTSTSDSNSQVSVKQRASKLNSFKISTIL